MNAYLTTNTVFKWSITAGFGLMLGVLLYKAVWFVMSNYVIHCLAVAGKVGGA